jgi:hypothetical protein
MHTSRSYDILHLVHVVMNRIIVFVIHPNHFYGFVMNRIDEIY